MTGRRWWAGWLAVAAMACGGSEEPAEACVDVGGGEDNAVLVFLGGDLVRFVPEVAYVHWACEEQRMEITLSQQSCDPMAAESRAMIQIYRQDIDSGLVEGGGTYTLGGETYRRAVFVSADDWAVGTCGDEVGEVTFDSLGTAAGARVAGSFDVPTTGCWGPAGVDLPDGSMRGAFDLRVAETYETACPMGGDPHPRDR